VRVWDAVTGVEQAVLNGHTEAVWSVGWSPDGSRIVSGSPDRTVRVWDAAASPEEDVVAPAIVNSSSPVSIGDVLDFERVERLDQDGADRLRMGLEPFVGQVQSLLDDGAFPEEEALQVRYELDQLKAELYGDKPGEPLGAVVHSYFSSLLAQSLPHMDVGELKAAADDAGIDSNAVVELAESGTTTGATPDDVSPAVEIIDRVPILAPADWSHFEKTKWSAELVGWTIKTAPRVVEGSAAGAALDIALNLSWMSTGWAAVVGGVIAIAGAIARPTGIKKDAQA
jgi:hypothetical protein